MERAIGVTPEKAGWITKRVYASIKKRLKRLPKAKTLVAHDTRTLLASVWMDSICASAKTVPAVLKELVQLKVAAMVGCPF